MPKFDALKDYQSATAEQKLAALGNELTLQIAIVNGFAALLKDYVKEATTANCISDDCNDWISKIFAASEDMKEILKILTPNPE